MALLHELNVDDSARRSDRRGFLRNLALASAGALGAAGVERLPRQARAIEPIARNGTSKFKFSLAAYSYRDLLTGKNAKLSLMNFIADCAKMGLEGTELTSYYFPAEVTPEYLRKIKEVTFRLGL